MFIFSLDWTRVMQHDQYDIEAIDKPMKAK